MKQKIITLALALAILSISTPQTTAQNAASKRSNTLDLKQVMQGLLQDNIQINEGIFSQDFQKIDSAASHIANHPKPAMTTLKKVIGYLGKEMPTFKSHDMKVHNEALEISKSAKQKNINDVMNHYQNMLDGCLACHNQFKERVSKILN